MLHKSYLKIISRDPLETARSPVVKNEQKTSAESLTQLTDGLAVISGNLRRLDWSQTFLTDQNGLYQGHMYRDKYNNIEYLIFGRFHFKSFGKWNGDAYQSLHSSLVYEYVIQALSLICSEIHLLVSGV